MDVIFGSRFLIYFYMELTSRVIIEIKDWNVFMILMRLFHFLLTLKKNNNKKLSIGIKSHKKM